MKNGFVIASCCSVLIVLAPLGVLPFLSIGLLNNTDDLWQRGLVFLPVAFIIGVVCCTAVAKRLLAMGNMSLPKFLVGAFAIAGGIALALSATAAAVGVYHSVFTVHTAAITTLIFTAYLCISALPAALVWWGIAHWQNRVIRGGLVPSLRATPAWRQERTAMTFSLEPIGYVTASRLHAEDDYWGNELASIQLTSSYSYEALQGLSDFSHAEVLFLFHEVDESKVITGARHPRNNQAWPAVGIFAQRGKNRPNRVGSTICRIVSVEGTKIVLAELDAIDRTPVIDIKPVMKEFLPREAVYQPAWSRELMRKYWLPSATDHGVMPDPISQPEPQHPASLRPVVVPGSA